MVPTPTRAPVSAAAFAPAVAIVPVSALAGIWTPARESLATRADESLVASADELPSPDIAATLVQTHTDERVILDARSPSDARFDALLADRVTGATRRVDPRLLSLLRSLVATFAKDGAPTQEAPRIEIVSGFRSPKLNEMLRKKGHHVASHSQHSLGQAVDFRIGLADHPTGDRIDQRDVDPREIEKRVRALGWVGGVGVYLSRDDWFVHCDVGPNRRWLGK